MQDRRESWRHVLVIRGTGMLRGVSLALAQQGRIVSVVARDAGRLDDLARDGAANGGLVLPLAVEVEETDAFVAAVMGRAAERGPFDCVVAWGLPELSLQAMAREVGKGGPWSLFQIRGSMAADPTDPLAEEKETLLALPRVSYHRVVLGWQKDGRRARWLTHDEISNGVLAAISSGAAEHIVGTVRPWSDRPAW